MGFGRSKNQIIWDFGCSFLKGSWLLYNWKYSVIESWRLSYLLVAILCVCLSSYKSTWQKNILKWSILRKPYWHWEQHTGFRKKPSDSCALRMVILWCDKQTNTVSKQRHKGGFVFFEGGQIRAGTYGPQISGSLAVFVVVEKGLMSLWSQPLMHKYDSRALRCFSRSMHQSIRASRKKKKSQKQTDTAKMTENRESKRAMRTQGHEITGQSVQDKHGIRHHGLFWTMSTLS